MNKQLITETLEHIRENPKQWNQGDWRHCFGGIAVRLAGYDIWGLARVSKADDSGNDTYVGLVKDVALDVLGLDPKFHNHNIGLFSYHNTFENLERIVGDLLCDSRN